jgi:hypothetical protein
MQTLHYGETDAIEDQSTRLYSHSYSHHAKNKKSPINESPNPVNFLIPKTTPATQAIPPIYTHPTAQPVTPPQKVDY